MPRKYSAEDRAKWLEEYEKGKSETAIANNHKRDLRTIKRGIIEARRSREFQVARIDLIREALKKHQEGLLASLSLLESSVALPAVDYAPESWYQGKEPAFRLKDKEKMRERLLQAEKSEKDKPSMLRQHLKNNRLWRALDQWRKVYTEHLLTRLELQYKIIAFIKDRTGLDIVSQSHAPPFAYGYTTGDMFYRLTLKNAISDISDADLPLRIRTDTARHYVMDGGNVLAELTGREEECRTLLLEAYGDVKKSTELAEVVATYKTLEKLLPPIKEAISEYRLLGLLPGSCNICERIGY